MIFIGIDSQSVEFKIASYQFPQNASGDWDGNWLNIYLNVKSKLGNWQTVDPSLTIWEFQDLIEWFETMANNKTPEYVDISFTEPNLSFVLLENLTADQKHFRIKFNLESRPLMADDAIAYYVDCSVNNEELKRIIEDLKNELAQYPERKSCPP
jgi:hypothetical protein